MDGPAAPPLLSSNFVRRHPESFVNPAKFQITVPLYEFAWDGTAFAGFPGLTITSARPELEGLEDHLAASEKSDLFFASHWLIFDWTVGESPSPQEIVNLVLLSLWLTKPTRAHAKFRFELNLDRSSSDHGGFFRSLERFGWVHGHVRNQVTTVDLSRSSRYFTAFLPIVQRRGRLHQALVLHAAGCWASQWHVKLICHAAAIEALLTYATGPHITRRLATSFACLTRRSAGARDSAFRRFRDLYNTRSDIMHGRIHNVPQAHKLRHLAGLEAVARAIWKAVLRSSRITITLEGSDVVRQAFFNARESGFKPPP